MQRNNQYYNVNNLIEFEKFVLLRIISQQFGNPSGYVGEKIWYFMMTALNYLKLIQIFVV